MKQTRSDKQKKKNSLAKYTIEVNEEQAKVISLALDIFSRMEAGQLEWIFSMIPWKYYEKLESVEPMLKELQLLLTGMQRGNLGIGNVSNSARIAFDLHQVIRHRLAWDKYPQGRMGVDFDPPRKWSNQPLAKIEQINKNKVYLIYSKEWNEWHTSDVVACALTKSKAEELIKELESENKIVGDNEDGSPVYENAYWISEYELAV